MGNSMAIGRHNINFEDMQMAINNEQTIYGKEKPLIINTLAAHQQNCLIAGTLTIEREIEVLNTYLKKNLMRERDRGMRDVGIREKEIKREIKRD